MILVVGAGPAGLATAYYLQQRGLPYRVLEKETIGATWQKHYDSLHLHTLREVSALPGLPMPASYPRFPSAAQVVRYLQNYARHFRLTVEPGIEVQRADYGPAGWRLETSQGTRQGHTLIVATGIWNTPYVAIFGGEEQFGGTIVHARSYRNPQPFAGQRVLVVGAGNSGTEIAVELSEQGVDTSIAIRTGVSFVPYPRSAPAMRMLAWFFRHAPRPLGDRLLRLVRRNFAHLGIQNAPGSLLDAYPVVGYELPAAVEEGRVRVYGRICRFVPGGVCFEDGQEVPFDMVILATGYRPTIGFVRHELEFDAWGFPRLDNGRSTINPHLYCVGFHYPATSGWLQAIGRVAREVVYRL